jgi:acyl-CoA thioesterase-2
MGALPMTALSAVLDVEDLGDGRWTAPHPTEDPEGRDVVFSGQMLAQMIMVSDAAGGHQKEVKSVHAVFARAGSYSGGRIEYVLDPMHSGRAWASDTITARQGDRLLARALVLLNAVEPDLMRHAPQMPDVPAPDACAPQSLGMAFPGVEVRAIERPGQVAPGSPPTTYLWVRSPQSYDSVAANQAVIAWSEPGLIIGAAIGAHVDTVDFGQAHRSISTGVISHTAHFHDHGDVGDWLLFVHEAPYAGHGRVFGNGSVFTRDGTLVSTFAQDSMVRTVDRELDFRRDM